MTSSTRRGRVRIGCSGWQYKHWKGDFYPAGLSQTRWFEYYASVFDTVELNSTFYRLPERDWSRHVTLTHSVTFTGSADLPVYVRVTQADGNQAWSSPIYLIA